MSLLKTFTCVSLGSNPISRLNDFDWNLEHHALRFGSGFSRLRRHENEFPPRSTDYLEKSFVWGIGQIYRQECTHLRITVNVNHTSLQLAKDFTPAKNFTKRSSFFHIFP